MKSDFEKSPKKGVTMGHSREECKSVSIFNQTSNPAPGNYNPFRDSNKNITMSPKLKFPSLWNGSNAPGPGSCTHHPTQTSLRKLTQRGPVFCQSTRAKTALRSTLLVLKSRTRLEPVWAQVPTRQ